MLEQARAEVEELHRFFVDWFAGRCENSDEVFELRLNSHLAPSFALIQPSGLVLERGPLIGALRHAWGTNPRLEIEIREPAARMIALDTVLITYQEWQRNARNASRPNGKRLSTAILRRSADLASGLVWLHVHETWL